MTQEEKMARLLDAQDHPETFTDEELQTMLQEADLRESAELMVRLKQAYIGKEIEDIDVEAEWQRLASQKQKTAPMMLKMAAAFVGLLVLSGIAYAAVHIVGNSHLQQTEIQDTTVIAHKASGIASEQTLQENQSLSEPKTFENIPLKEITAELASFYHVAIEVRNADSAALRLYYPWNPQMPLQQVVEELNRFEKVQLILINDTLIIE